MRALEPEMANVVRDTVEGCSLNESMISAALPSTTDP